jgi:hypothetical protein
LRLANKGRRLSPGRHLQFAPEERTRELAIPDTEKQYRSVQKPDFEAAYPGPVPRDVMEHERGKKPDMASVAKAVFQILPIIQKLSVSFAKFEGSSSGESSGESSEETGDEETRYVDASSVALFAKTPTFGRFLNRIRKDLALVGFDDYDALARFPFLFRLRSVLIFPGGRGVPPTPMYNSPTYYRVISLLDLLISQLQEPQKKRKSKPKSTAKAKTNPGSKPASVPTFKTKPALKAKAKAR